MTDGAGKKIFDDFDFVPGLFFAAHIAGGLMADARQQNSIAFFRRGQGVFYSLHAVRHYCCPVFSAGFFDPLVTETFQ